MATKRLGRRSPVSLGLCLATAMAFASFAQRLPRRRDSQLEAPPIVHQIQAATERLEMTANTSRMLTLDQKIPRAQVNNREILELTPLSPNEMQVFAKKPGVTQINLWNEDNEDPHDRRDGLRRRPRAGDAHPHRVSARLDPRQAAGAKRGALGLRRPPGPRQPDHPHGRGLLSRRSSRTSPSAACSRSACNVKVNEVSRTRLRTLGMDWSTIRRRRLLRVAASAA